MKRFRRMFALLLAMTALLTLSTMFVSAEKTVVHDLMEPGGWSEETWDAIQHDYTDGVHTISRKALNDGGAQVIYFGPTYHTGMMLAYDIELDGEYCFIAIHNNYPGNENADNFLNGKIEFFLADKIAAVAGVEPTVQLLDDGEEVPYLPEGHYKGIVDLSEFIPDGFTCLQHMYIGFTGKQVVIRELALVSGVEASPTIIPTTTTEVPLTTTQAETTTTQNGGATTTAQNGGDSVSQGLPVGAIVGIVVGAVVVIGGVVAVICIVAKKKKKPQQ